jgi:WD40 repeat protein
MRSPAARVVVLAVVGAAVIFGAYRFRQGLDETPPLPRLPPKSKPALVPRSSQQPVELYPGAPIETLTQIENGPGVVVCEPAARDCPPEVADLGSGCSRWLRHQVGGHAELSKTPSWTSVQTVEERFETSRPRPSAAAIQLARALGATHAVGGEITGRGAGCRLEYALWDCATGKPVGAPLVLTGAAAEIVEQLPAAARDLCGRLGIADPRIADPKESAQDLAFIGGLPGGALPFPVEKRLEKLSYHSPLARLMFGLALQYSVVRRSRLDAGMVLSSAAEGRNVLALYELARAAQLPSPLLAPQIDKERQAHPDSFLLRLASAYLAHANKDEDGARRAAEEAVRASARNPRAWLLLSDIVSAKAQQIRRARTVGDLPEAELETLTALYRDQTQLIRRAVELDPQDPEAWLMLSVAAGFGSDGKTADTALWKALALAPAFPRAYWWGLELYAPKWYGNPQRRKQLLRLAAQTAFEDPDARLYMARSVHRAGEAKLALSFLRSPTEKAEFRRWLGPPPTKIARQAAATGDWKFIAAHNGGVRGIAWSADGKQLASVGNDKVVRLWTEAGEERRLLGHTGSVTAVSWSPEPRILATSGADKSIRLWRVDSGKEIQAMGAPYPEIHTLAWDRRGQFLVSAGEEGIARVWDLNSTKITRRLGRGMTRIDTMQAGPDGRTLALAGVVSSDSILQLWDPEAGKQLQYLSCPKGLCTALSWSPDAARIAAAHNGTVTVWSARTGAVLQTIQAAKDTVFSLAWSPDGRYLVSSSRAATMPLWDPATGREVGRIPGRGELLAWHPDGKRLAAAHRGGVYLWKLEKLLAQASRKLGGPSPAVAQAASAETASAAGTAALPSFEVGTAVRIPLEGTTIRALAHAPDGRTFALGLSAANATRTPSLSIRDGRTGVELRSFTPTRQNAEFTEIVFSPDGTRLAVISGLGVAVLDAASGTERWHWDGTIGMRLAHLRFSPDGRRVLVAAEGEGQVRTWDAASGRPQETLKDEGFGPLLALPRGGPLAATAVGSLGRWGDISLWDLPSGRRKRLLEGHTDLIRGLDFSPDGSVLISASADHTLRAWSTASGKSLFRAPLADGTEGALRFSRDGKWLVMAARGGLQFLRAGTGKPAGRVDLPGGAALFSLAPDGESVVAVERAAPVVHIRRVRPHQPAGARPG